jgi:endonuclease/exonuclease/phosphatase family metal-dependent hydrolase
MRVITYNTHGSLGIDGVRSTPRIAEALRPLSADIICFQEIHQRLPWSGREDQPLVLSRILQRRFLFQRNLRIGFGGYGLGIATRGQAAAVRERLLTSGKEQRGALEVTVTGLPAFRRIVVFCTHWGLDTNERSVQAAELAAAVNEASRPVIVCGDFNEGPDGPAVMALIRETGLIDSGAAQNCATFVSDTPGVRIDYILHSPDLAAERVVVLQSPASDHLPVWSDLKPAGQVVSRETKSR